MCTICGVDFSQRPNLKRHIEGVHEKKQHACPSCEKIFSDSGNLKKHINTDKLIVAESGLKNHQDLIMLKENSVNIFLIGESLMRKPDVTSATKEILGVKN